jgi:hypothetical protein
VQDIGRNQEENVETGIPEEGVPAADDEESELPAAMPKS